MNLHTHVSKYTFKNYRIKSSLRDALEILIFYQRFNLAWNGQSRRHRMKI